MLDQIWQTSATVKDISGGFNILTSTSLMSGDFGRVSGDMDMACIMRVPVPMWDHCVDLWFTKYGQITHSAASLSST